MIYMPRGVQALPLLLVLHLCIIGGGRLRDDPRYSLFDNAKHRAKKKGIPFAIAIEEIFIPTLLSSAWHQSY